MCRIVKEMALGAFGLLSVKHYLHCRHCIVTCQEGRAFDNAAPSDHTARCMFDFAVLSSESFTKKQPSQ